MKQFSILHNYANKLTRMVQFIRYLPALSLIYRDFISAQIYLL